MKSPTYTLAYNRIDATWLILDVNGVIVESGSDRAAIQTALRWYRAQK